MRRFLAPVVLPALALLALALAPAASGELGSPRVVGGSAATPSGAPWQALVPPGIYLCGGSILDATHVLTAADRVYDDAHHRVIAPSTVQVRAGITDRYLDRGRRDDPVMGVVVDAVGGGQDV